MNFSQLRLLRPIEWLLAVLLIVAPLYFHPNIGGTGFRIPNNIIVWGVASIIGFYSLYHLAKSQYFYIPRYFLLIALFPVLAFFSGMISGVEIAEHWTFRILYVWGGLLFFFGLFQYQLKQGQLDRLLFMIVIAGFLHALVGLSQIIWAKNIPSWLPYNPSGIPTGLFQQINNQASFQVTTLMVAFWLTTRPFIRKAPRWRFVFIVLAICCATFVVSYSGSRVGLLGFVLALPLFMISRWHVVKQDKKRWYVIIILFVTSLASANLIESNRGLASALEKATAINAGYSGSARLGIYTIAFNVIKEEPVFGHGIGSFVRVWQLAKPDFYAQHSNAQLPNQRVSHPHNETVFWLVEGGAVAGVGLLAVLFSVILTLIKLPHSRRYAYVALLIPIALHTQVELPFYISASHWFVFLLLLFVVLQPSTQRYRINLSNAAIKMVKVVAVSGGVVAIVFLASTMVANLEFKRYLLKEEVKGRNPFPVSMYHPYFKRLATQTMMASLLKSSMRYGLEDHVRSFIQWGEQELAYNPHIMLYKLTVKANHYLKQNQQACTIAKEGWAVYPDDPILKDAVASC